jgi:hypothetical protein
MTTISAIASSVSMSMPNSVFLRLPLRCTVREVLLYAPLAAFLDAEVLEAGLAAEDLLVVLLL